MPEQKKRILRISGIYTNFFTMGFGGDFCANHTKQVHFTQRVSAHRRPAAGDRGPRQGVSGRQSVPDAFRRYGLRQDLYDGERHSGPE